MYEVVRLTSLNVKGPELTIKRRKILFYLKQRKSQTGFPAGDTFRKGGLVIITK